LLLSEDHVVLYLFAKGGLTDDQSGNARR